MKICVYAIRDGAVLLGMLFWQLLIAMIVVAV